MTTHLKFMTANFNWVLISGLETFSSLLKPPALLPNSHFQLRKTDNQENFQKYPPPTHLPTFQLLRHIVCLFSRYYRCLFRDQRLHSDTWPHPLSSTSGLHSSNPLLLNIKCPLSTGSFPSVFKHYFSHLKTLSWIQFSPPQNKSTKISWRRVVCIHCLQLLSFHPLSNPRQRWITKTSLLSLSHQ